MVDRSPFKDDMWLHWRTVPPRSRPTGSRSHRFTGVWHVGRKARAQRTAQGRCAGASGDRKG